MYDAYLLPVLYAFLAFPLAAAVFTFPFLVYQYRKYGYINMVRAITLYALLLYLMNAYFLVILPFPASPHNLPLAHGDLQLVPFQFVSDFLKETSVSLHDPKTYMHIFKERAFLQVLFNILLTVPFGMFLRYYFRQGWWSALIWSFLLSLSFETIQLTGIFGIYDHAYRIFDVDDLICNTFGGMVGLLIASWISERLPDAQQMDRQLDRSQRRVTYTRRGIAFIIDMMAWMLLSAILMGMQVPLVFWLSSGLYFILLPYITRGRTLGKWMVRIHLVLTEQPERRIPVMALLVRYGLLYWGFFGLNRLLNTPFVISMPARLEAILYLSILFVMNAGFFIHLITRFFKKGSLLFYEQISHTSHQITWPDQPGSSRESSEEHPSDHQAGSTEDTGDTALSPAVHDRHNLKADDITSRS
ncbi:VanZ family protein [Paenibacillus bovis]|uniref:Teicoplanin resistance protein VanZ n=1 Tax=Paenibacillus bovis TaxID=1616788 RepID=A0A172ZK48_9BACL|nr:VanZ family protein [Paenibacillus bovis]ANF97913.1 teicoplanin resistance protein VanZ [Paenibacillus bovis]